MRSGFDFAEEDGRKWLGKTVLLPDKERGGVTSKTFLNVTFGKCKKKPKLYKHEDTITSEVGTRSLLYT